MSTIIFRTIAPYIAALAALFSVFVLLRGHNEPGGGFIGGLIAASAIATYGIAWGVAPVRRAMVVHPIALAGFGVFLAAVSGFLSLFAGMGFLSGLWVTIHVLGVDLALSSVLLFDIGVYFTVVGAISTIGLTLEEPEQD
ncbi:MnhB domain-containing protein [Amorphus orientalis]|uniref:Multicomponent Na+:H+ antiporter subunit B n=1 Tax=Amorphus orientalis TaxID=649198 RepID=A0AAE4ASC6_9HYPH|nr:MnhB domain-containing protein [Amorphus orientalis]MDQ0315103.1 multicomponent Na+:H+ antiporter subunit B [Amorphus orientalis]